MKKLGILIAIILCLVSVTPLVAENNGIISGQVINGSPGGGFGAHLELSLKAYTVNSSDPEVITGLADGDGNFSFSGLNTDSAISYFVSATYTGVKYYSQNVTFAEGEISRTAQLTVYETTENDSAISVYLSHTVIFVENGSLNITELFFLLNDSDYTYVGSQQALSGIRVTAMLPMPAEASDVQLGSEVSGNAIFTENGLAYTLPLLPGYTQASYAYNLTVTDSDYSLNRQVEYEQAVYEVLVQGAGGVDSQQLTKEEPLELEGVFYEYFSGKSIPAGETVIIQLSGLSQDTSQQTVLWVLVTLVVLGSIFALLLRRGGRKVPLGTLDNDEQQLLVKIAHLDDDFENSLIEEERYRLQRNDLKNRIIRMRQNNEED